MIPPITAGHPVLPPSWNRALVNEEYEEACRFTHGNDFKGIHTLFASHAAPVIREQMLDELEAASARLIDEFIMEGYEDGPGPPFSVQRAFECLRADLADAIRTPPGVSMLTQRMEEFRWNVTDIALPGAGILLRAPEVETYLQTDRPAHLVHFLRPQGQQLYTLTAALELMPQKRDQLLAAYLIELDIIGSLAYAASAEEAGSLPPLSRDLAEWAIREMINELFLAARRSRG